MDLLYHVSSCVSPSGLIYHCTTSRVDYTKYPKTGLMLLKRWTLYPIALFTLLLSRAMISRAALGWPGYIPTIVAGSLQDRTMWKENIRTSTVRFGSAL